MVDPKNLGLRLCCCVVVVEGLKHGNDWMIKFESQKISETTLSFLKSKNRGEKNKFGGDLAG